jgi:hypothetical protein
MRGIAVWLRGAIPVWLRGAIPFVLALALWGCGSGGSSSGASSASRAGATQVSSGSSADSSHAPHGAGVLTQASKAELAGGQVLVTVDGKPITKATYEHWLAVTAALSGSPQHGANPASKTIRDQTLGFLISIQWLFDEAATRGISVSGAAIHKHLAEAQQKLYHTSPELQSYLAKAKETMADLLLRAKAELLESAISQRVLATKHTAAEERVALMSFRTAFQAKWKARTSCQPGYVIEDCKQYKRA